MSNEMKVKPTLRMMLTGLQLPVEFESEDKSMIFRVIDCGEYYAIIENPASDTVVIESLDEVHDFRPRLAQPPRLLAWRSVKSGRVFLLPEGREPGIKEAMRAPHMDEVR